MAIGCSHVQNKRIVASASTSQEAASELTKSQKIANLTFMMAYVNGFTILKYHEFVSDKHSFDNAFKPVDGNSFDSIERSQRAHMLYIFLQTYARFEVDHAKLVKALHENHSLQDFAEALGD